ncbi:serine/threonine protein phosphatase [Pseudooceanicola lipolyticus]|uniref:Serine/threonine protein phosphatase n=1 Tax=Pseudooceanicola lipolyticus TaxID=2029104 RepID=A0A2M8ITU7_9RHOB|nr:metallophosphoesterase family protein [Pseudooceanicola lipolyticus]PJE33951.1 serine/threonine protein phosphatase [Pseudooceanicola lipolyticus]
MKILAFSDLHLARKAAAVLVAESRAADLVIGAGDFCSMRQGLDEAMELLSGITAPIIAVPGNAESAEELRAAALPNMTVLHGERADSGGLRFFGLGNAVPETPFGGWSCDIGEAEATRLLAPCDRADVLVLHSPPKGVADSTSAGMSVGSQAIHDAISRLQPRLALCGHIHDSWGQSGMIGATKVVNLGPTPNWFEVTP